MFSSTANTISIFLGNGDATFQPWLTEAMDYAPYGIAVGDFNGDGRLDLAVTNSSDNTVSILLQKPLAARSDCNSRIGAKSNYHKRASDLYNGGMGQPNNYANRIGEMFEQGTTVLGTVPLEKGQASFTTAFASLWDVLDCRQLFW